VVRVRNTAAIINVSPAPCVATLWIASSTDFPSRRNKISIREKNYFYQGEKKNSSGRKIIFVREKKNFCQGENLSSSKISESGLGTVWK
jgi:hypothetical protein